MEISYENVVSTLAFLMSGYATWTTSKFNKRQKSLIESQERLNSLLENKERQEVVLSKKADLAAAFYKLGSNKYRFKIWNQGKATAKNVQILFPEGNDVLMASEIEEKFPLEALEPHQSVELIAIVHMQTKPKHCIRFKWTDESSAENEKTIYATL